MGTNNYAVSWINFYDKELIIKQVKSNTPVHALEEAFPSYGSRMMKIHTKEDAQMSAINEHWGFDVMELPISTEARYMVSIATFYPKNVTIKLVHATSWREALFIGFNDFYIDLDDIEEAKDYAAISLYQFDILQVKDK